MTQLTPRRLGLRLDFRSKTPIVVQIERQVTSLVEQGRLGAGDQLPTVRALAEALGVNFNTVARAYRRLDAAGVISTQHGRGTYVLHHRRKKIRRSARRLRALAEQYLEEAEAIGFKAPAALEGLRRLIEGGTRH